ncbi:MAG: hypothetical protein ACYDH6_07915 [Acidimicrobiales bacterium]
MTSLAEKVVAIHRALGDAALPHAFGGALALAWCTQQPRGTSDIDVNVFVPPSSVDEVLDALPAIVTRGPQEIRQLRGDGQTRLHWDATPIDIFLNTSAFHETAMARVSLEPFAGEMIPFLACSDLAVFKAFFDRRRDWADLEEMVVARSIDVERVVDVLAAHLGADDPRIAQLRAIEGEIRHRGD